MVPMCPPYLWAIVGFYFIYRVKLYRPDYGGGQTGAVWATYRSCTRNSYYSSDWSCSSWSKTRHEISFSMMSSPDGERAYDKRNLWNHVVNGPFICKRTTNQYPHKVVQVITSACFVVRPPGEVAPDVPYTACLHGAESAGRSRKGSIDLTTRIAVRSQGRMNQVGNHHLRSCYWNQRIKDFAGSVTPLW